ncbi:DotD/TraH family lipoprotein (plasmid) [Candidatus Fukatsuia symbiotica]|uniref:Conjugal transfer protein TraH n=1 Tax=Candidatus Fukatsuia symbiotica TaxID=1878942 RepID=A0A2U8I8L7_9GAMM|nr:DotD/TraH family lipoprotein [Candidatus Fukatsuia symbiotica]AWK15501.1 conjugal transfer protein TraH [Candidatus Fukatsuia symbiotica]MEA9445893.1 DotD/TraH family lipoprotein [Candidatus Fukatsuia symbiotica]
MKNYYYAILAGLLLSGCQVPKTDQTAAQALDKETSAISRTQQQLHQAGAINQKMQRFPQAIRSDAQRLDLDWQGDAVELLAQLAYQRGLTFAYSGVRLPLPLNVHARYLRFDDLLRQIEAQISWRATLRQQSNTLHLYFALPDKRGTVS